MKRITIFLPDERHEQLRLMRELGIRRVLTVDAQFSQSRLGFQCLP